MKLIQCDRCGNFVYTSEANICGSCDEVLCSDCFGDVAGDKCENCLMEERADFRLREERGD